MNGPLSYHSFNNELPFSTTPSAYKRNKTADSRFETQPQHWGAPPPPPPAPPSNAQRPREVRTLHSGSRSATSFSNGVPQHTTAAIPHGSRPEMDLKNIQHAASSLRSTANNQSFQPRQPVSYGSVAGSLRADHGSSNIHGSQSNQLSPMDTGDPLFVDTDLCLSLVHETRPSFEIKTAGKKPLSPGHLLSLVDPELADKPVSPFKTYSSNVAPLDSPIYTTTTKETRVYTTTYPSTPSTTSKPAGRGANENYDPSSERPSTPIQVAVRSSSPQVWRPPVSPKTVRAQTASPQRHVLYETPIHMDNDDFFDDFQRRHPGPITTDPPLGRSDSMQSLRTRMITPPPDPYLGHGPHGPYTSPRARGFAPAPSDQPIRNPVRHGVEGQVDTLTQRLVRNMRTGEGAAGEQNCAKCGEGIGGGRPGCTALNQSYHLDCFTCSVCDKKLAGGSFYSVEGKPFCENDYVDTLEKCNVCNKPIMDRVLRASGRPYHPQCFTCTHCHKCMDGVPFTVDSANNVHCVTCFHEKYAPRCAQCHKPITPESGKEESLRVVAMDKSYHIECYKCEDCGMKLSSKIEGHECYPLDDHLLCKNCNATRVRQLTKK